MYSPPIYYHLAMNNGAKYKSIINNLPHLKYYKSEPPSTWRKLSHLQMIRSTPCIRNTCKHYKTFLTNTKANLHIPMLSLKSFNLWLSKKPDCSSSIVPSQISATCFANYKVENHTSVIFLLKTIRIKKCWQ